MGLLFDNGIRIGYGNIITKELTESQKQTRGLKIMEYGMKRDNPEYFDAIMTDEQRQEQEDLNDQQQQENQ